MGNQGPKTGALSLPACLSYTVCLYAHLSVEAQAHSAYEKIFPKKSALLTFLVWPGEWEKSEGDEGGHGEQTKIPCEVVSL